MMGFFKKLHNKVTPPDANVELKLSKYAFALGDNLEGSLSISSREDFDSTEVRCEIACTEESKAITYQYDPAIRRSVPREVMQSAVLFAAKPVLSGATHMGNGEAREFPLKINIPAGGRPTYQGVDRRVTWTLKGVVAVDGRPDATSRTTEIQVVQPTVQPVITGQSVVKEVIREVVKIPCKYCGTLFDQLDTACPNCGAKRTG
jgi:hypothetical protein